MLSIPQAPKISFTPHPVNSITTFKLPIVQLNIVCIQAFLILHHLHPNSWLLCLKLLGVLSPLPPHAGCIWGEPTELWQDPPTFRLHPAGGPSRRCKAGRRGRVGSVFPASFLPGHGLVVAAVPSLKKATDHKGQPSPCSDALWV